mmetsp:Transcript_33596/g.96466  ORF Transcript_33596/g.96466 Transcript_33596/m.96466 type:complete len:213 (+) Transcript_33596:81-719(+)
MQSEWIYLPTANIDQKMCTRYNTCAPSTGSPWNLDLNRSLGVLCSFNSSLGSFVNHGLGSIFHSGSSGGNSFVFIGIRLGGGSIYRTSVATVLGLLLTGHGSALSTFSVLRFQLFRSQALVTFSFEFSATSIAFLGGFVVQRMVPSPFTLAAALTRVLALPMILFTALGVVDLSLLRSHGSVALSIFQTTSCQLVLMRLGLLDRLVVCSLFF